MLEFSQLMFMCKLHKNYWDWEIWLSFLVYRYWRFLCLSYWSFTVANKHQLWYLNQVTKTQYICLLSKQTLNRMKFRCSALLSLTLPMSVWITSICHLLFLGTFFGKIFDMTILVINFAFSSVPFTDRGKCNHDACMHVFFSA